MNVIKSLSSDHSDEIFEGERLPEACGATKVRPLRTGDKVCWFKTSLGKNTLHGIDITEVSEWKLIYQKY